MKRKTANEYLSWYILLRDAAKLAEERPGINQDGLYQWCECCTCHKLINRFDLNSQAGHFIPKGHGGSSGVYFDERNVHAQCITCNKWEEGNRIEYLPFMLKTYGEEVVAELRRKHKLPRLQTIDHCGAYYREAYKELKQRLGLTSERKAGWRRP